MYYPYDSLLLLLYYIITIIKCYICLSPKFSFAMDAGEIPVGKGLRGVM